MVEMKFGFRTAGRDHEVGDTNCAGCAAMEGQRYPRRHNEYEGVHCLGLVHAEEVDNPTKIVYMCDACNANPRFRQVDRSHSHRDFLFYRPSTLQGLHQTKLCIASAFEES